MKAYPPCPVETCEVDGTKSAIRREIVFDEDKSPKKAATPGSDFFNKMMELPSIG